MIADFDADGNGDVVVGDVVGPQLRVYWGAADGGVAETDTLTTTGGSTRIAVAHLNGDDHLDFVTADTHVTPFFRVPGQRQFVAGAAVPVDVGGANVHVARGLAVANFDGVNGNDIAISAANLASAAFHGRYRVLTNNGSGTFSLGGDGPVHGDFHTGGNTHAGYLGEIVTGRFNNDSDPDLAYRYARVVAGNGTDFVRIMYGAAGTGFTTGPDLPSENAGSLDDDLVAANLDGDAYDDLVIAESAVVRWGGNGTFSAPQTVDSDFVNDLRVADLTDDGLLDIVAVGTPLRIHVNRGARAFSLGSTLTFPDDTYGLNVAVGDLDADPRDDLALTFDDDAEVDEYDDSLFKLLTRDPGLPNPFPKRTTPPPADDDDDPPPAGPGPGTGPGPGPGPVTPPMVIPPGGTPGTVIPVRTNQIATLPSNRRCASRRNFRVRLRRPPEGVGVREARVLVNGKRVKVVRGARLTAPVDLRGLPKGRVTVTIRITLADGRVLRGTRKYKTCATKKTKGGKFDPKKKG